MRKRRSLIFLSSFVALVAFFAMTGIASAHEVRPVGPYTFVVGFLNEPAYVNLQNSLDLTICKGAKCEYTVKDGSRVVANPVEGAEETLKVEVSFGANAPLALEIGPRYANPGKYTGYFQPTQVGAYTFHIFGMLENNTIDEKFTSSPTGFGEVETLTAYPAQQTASANTTATLQSQVQQAQDAANRANTFGIIGGVVGLLGLILAGVALVRRPAVAPASASGTPQRQPVEDLRG